MHKLLLLDDEYEIGENIKEILQFEGYQVDFFQNGNDAVNSAMENEYDLMILDIMLKPSGDDYTKEYTNGLGVARVINKRKKVPYIFLTAKNQSSDIMAGLDMGAEDYITKPYDLSVLLARLRRVLKRIEAHKQSLNSDELFFKEIRLSEANKKVFVNNEEVHLAPQLYEILRYLLSEPYKVIMKEEFYKNVWGYDSTNGKETNNLEVNIKRLREALGTGAQYIQTIRGKGYALQDLD